MGTANCGVPQKIKRIVFARINRTVEINRWASWQLADEDRVTTYKTYHGTHEGPFLGIAPTHRRIHFETVDVMRVQNGKITDHWGVANLLSLMQQIGGVPAHHDPD